MDTQFYLELKIKAKMMQSSFSLSYWRDVILTAPGPAIWGSTYIVTTQFLPPDRPFTAALIRVLPAGVLLLLFTRRLPASREADTIIQCAEYRCFPGAVVCRCLSTRLAGLLPS
ncbi:hypothetical protein LZ023_39600 (plasmid) [Pseudomonas silvicola]|nr:hypothetical protein LZ023_39600 [Pseudomonas silvicola]